MTLEAVELIVRSILEEKYLDEKNITYTDLLSEIGLNSLKAIELIVDLENTFNFEFEDEMINYETLRTINSIAQYVYERSTESTTST